MSWVRIQAAATANALPLAKDSNHVHNSHGNNNALSYIKLIHDRDTQWICSAFTERRRSCLNKIYMQLRRRVYVRAVCTISVEWQTFCTHSFTPSAPSQLDIVYSAKFSGSRAIHRYDGHLGCSAFVSCQVKMRACVTYNKR